MEEEKVGFTTHPGMSPTRHPNPSKVEPAQHFNLTNNSSKNFAKERKIKLEEKIKTEKLKVQTLASKRTDNDKEISKNHTSLVERTQSPRKEVSSRRLSDNKNLEQKIDKPKVLLEWMRAKQQRPKDTKPEKPERKSSIKSRSDKPTGARSNESARNTTSQNKKQRLSNQDASSTNKKKKHSEEGRHKKEVLSAREQERSKSPPSTKAQLFSILDRKVLCKAEKLIGYWGDNGRQVPIVFKCIEKKPEAPNSMLQTVDLSKRKLQMAPEPPVSVLISKLVKRKPHRGNNYVTTKVILNLLRKSKNKMYMKQSLCLFTFFPQDPALRLTQFTSEMFPHSINHTLELL